MEIPSVEEALKGEGSVFLASAEDDQPRVRPVTLVENQGELFVLTGTNAAKIQQIQANEKVEIIKLVPYEKNTGYIRFSALAKIVTDKKIRERLANETSFFCSYWKSAKDPNYALVHIIPQKIEYLKPGHMYPEPVEKLDFTR